MLSALLHASPAEPGLRPASPDGTPIAAYAEQGEPIANQQQRFRWDALNVTNATTCGGDKCYFQGEREGEGWLVGGRSYLIQQSRGWAFAEELRVDFGVDHLLRGAPFLATLPYKQAKYLNAKLNTSLHRQKRPIWRVGGMLSLNVRPGASVQCTYGLRVPASCAMYVPEAQGSLPRDPRTVRTPYTYIPASGVLCVPRTVAPQAG